MNPVLLHRTYFGNNEMTFRKAWELGFSGVEVNAPGFKEPTKEISSHADRLAAWQDKWLIGTIVLNFPMGLMADNAWDERNAHFDAMAHSFRVASEKLGVKIVNTVAGGAILAKGCTYTQYGKNGSAAATDEQWDRGVEMMKTACVLAGEYGIVLTVETHGCLLHDTPRTVLEFLRRVHADNLMINLDVPNMVLTLGDLLSGEDMESLLPHIGHVHMKNLRFILGGGFLLEGVSVGAINYRPIIGRLIDMGYAGALSLEFPGGMGDTELVAREDFCFVKKLLIEDMEKRLQH